MFRLLRYYSIASAVAILLATFAVTFIFRHHELKEIVSFTEKQNLALAQSFANQLEPRFSNFIATAPTDDESSLKSRPEIKEIRDLLVGMAANLPVHKFKIYDQNGLTIFSTEASEIGQVNIDSPEFLLATKSGKPKSKLTFRSSFKSFNKVINDRHIVESYFPMRTDGAKLSGVLELYSDVTPFAVKIQKATIELAAIFLVILSLLYGVLIIIVRHADKIIKLQYADLQRSKEDTPSSGRGYNSGTYRQTLDCSWDRVLTLG